MSRVVRGRDAAGRLTEAAWQAQVIGLARQYRWRHIYHAPNGGHRGQLVPGQIPEGRGFPDLLLIRAAELVVAELKTDRGRMGPGQDDWLDAFRSVGIEAYVWRPRDFEGVHARLAAVRRGLSAAA